MEPKTFQTSDLYLAPALKLSGFKLLDLDKDKRGWGIFIFEDQPNRVRCVKDYYSGDLVGSLKLFSNIWADLKSMVSETEKERG